jgi:hypothetical protein
MPPHARAVLVGRGHRFAAYPRCSTDKLEGDVGWILVLLLAGSAPRQGQEATCQPKECLRAIQRHAALAAVEPRAGEMVGIWSRGSGLAGRLLYVFEDGSYLHTEWADVMAETVSDKGRWRVADGVVLLTSDAEVTWPVHWDQRYLVLSSKGVVDPFLFGLDRSMAAFRHFLSMPSEFSADDAVQAICLRRTPWKPAQAEQTRMRLLSEAWHPEWFAEGK